MGIVCRITDTSINPVGNFTLYHISVQHDSNNSNNNNNNNGSSNNNATTEKLLNKKQHILKKRFNDFFNLKKELEAAHHAEMPYEFPNKRDSFTSKQSDKIAHSEIDSHNAHYIKQNKSWLSTNFLDFYKKNNKSTDPNIVQYRKHMLETFLNDMLHDSFDTKWKNDKLTLDFLKITAHDLQNNSVTTNSSKNRKAGGDHQNDLDDATSHEKDEWWMVYRECKQILDSPQCSLPDIMRVRLKMQRLEQQTDKSQIKNKNEAKKSKFLASFHQQLTKISVDHDKARLVQDNDNNLKKLFGDLPTTNTWNNDNISSPHDSSLSVPGGARDSNSTVIQPGRLLGTNQEMYQDQKQMLKSQEQELEDLHKIVLSQKNIGLMINQELQTQNEIMDLLNNDINHTSSKLTSASRRAKKFNNET